MHGLALPLDLQRLQRLERRNVVDQPPRELPDHDRVSLCRFSELCRDPDRLAGDETLPRIRRRRDHLAGLQPDADLDLDPVLLRKPLVECGDPDADVECGAGGSERVVLVRDGNAECGHDRVAGVLLHGAAMSHERRRHRLEIALQHAPERLRVQRLCERHGLDDVDEEDRDEPSKLHRRPRDGRLFEQERLVLAEDRRLELAELPAGLDAELLDERLARGVVSGQRVCLPPRPVERKHELRTRALAEGLHLDEGLELGQQLRMSAEGEVGLDPPFEGDGTELFDARDLRLGERLVDEVRKRRATPERERLAQRAFRCDRIASVECCATFVREAFEAADIDALTVELELVARQPRRDDRAKGLAELGDVHLHGMCRRLRGIAGPQRVDDPVDGDDAWTECEHCEQRARLRPSEGDERAVPLSLDRSEEPYLELCGACPARSVHAVRPRSFVCAGTFSRREVDFHPALSRR
jgi:hypothetical protein